ncbi:MAG: class I SAM-dependent rRNA methyltransferase, partial [Mesorhizobium sp.]
MKSFRDKRRDSRPHSARTEPVRPHDTFAPARPKTGERPETKSPHRQDANPAPRVLQRREGPLPAERLPLILEVAPNADYALLDSGAGEKLEQYGPYRIVRPEGQAIWQRALAAKEWERADAIFTGDT